VGQFISTSFISFEFLRDKDLLSLKFIILYNINMKKNVSILLAIGIIVLAVLFSVFRVNSSINKNQNEELLTQAKQASLFVSGEDILSLSRNSEDLTKDNYKNILTKLTSFREADEHIRFLYILGYDEGIGKQFFFLDTEPVTSKDYSAPGSIFEDTREIDIENYKASKSYIEGPYVDSFGEWYSAYEPILDKDGKIVALLGIDVSSDIWKNQSIFATSIIIVVGFLILGFVLFFLLSIYKKQSSIESLEKETSFLSSKEKKFKDLQRLVKVGEFNMYLFDKFINLDEYLTSVLKIKNNSKISFEDFSEIILPSDEIKFRELIEKINKHEINEFDINISLLNKEGQYLKYDFIGKLKDPNSNHRVVNGILKNIEN